MLAKVNLIASYIEFGQLSHAFDDHLFNDQYRKNNYKDILSSY